MAALVLYTSTDRDWILDTGASGLEAIITQERQDCPAEDVEQRDSVVCAYDNFGEPGWIQSRFPQEGNHA